MEIIPIFGRGVYLCPGVGRGGIVTFWQVFIVRQCGGRQWREVSGGD